MSEFIGTKLTMNLGERSYDIIIKSGSLENLYQFARLDRRVPWSPTAACPPSTPRWWPTSARTPHHHGAPG